MNILKYVYGYFKFDSKELRTRASKEARAWLISQGRGTPHYPDAYRNDFIAFTRAYCNAELHVKALAYAKGENKQA